MSSSPENNRPNLEHKAPNAQFHSADKKFVPAFILRQQNPSDFQRAIHAALREWKDDIDAAETANPWWSSPALLQIRNEHYNEYLKALNNAIGDGNENGIVGCHALIIKKLSAAHKPLWFYQSGKLRGGYNAIEELIGSLVKGVYSGDQSRFLSFSEAMQDVTDYLQNEDKRFERWVPGLAEERTRANAEHVRLQEEVKLNEQKRLQAEAEAEQKRAQDKAEAEQKRAQDKADHKREMDALAESIRREVQSARILSDLSRANQPNRDEAKGVDVPSAQPAMPVSSLLASSGSPLYTAPVIVKAKQERGDAPLVDVDLRS